ncbi:MAG TPA: multiheme c-type cytochrome [Bryobacteraceae bacterium]|nr:multiheme c-type cytochrome [Bryobacteraceae bacterium]
MWRFALALLVVAVASPAVQDCGECHAREARSWRESAHAHALKPPEESAFFSSLPPGPIGEARGGYLLEFAPAGTSFRVTGTRGSDSASAMIAWVFGAGRRAETPVAAGAERLELRISYYLEDARYDLTLGHRRGVSASAKESIGIAQSANAIRKCFGCHSTGGMPGDKNFVPGVQCAACHGDGIRPANISAGHHGPMIRPGMAVCTKCHRADPEGNPGDSINVRYQAVRLLRSRCYKAGALTCVTCHNPHENARSDWQWYRGRCLSCHPDQTSKGNCLECHMPRASITPHLSFTDHYIRLRVN